MGKKQAQCDPADPDDAQCGDHWDHVAYDPEHRLVLAVVPGGRTVENTEAIVEEMARRLDPAKDLLITTDELPAPAYESAIHKTFAEPVEEPGRRRPGRPRRVSCRRRRCRHGSSLRPSASGARVTASWE